MIRVTLDADLRAKLHDLTQAVELCDESGEVIGYALPKPPPPQDGSMEPQISEEELERREREGGPGYSTEEVLKYLEKL